MAASTEFLTDTEAGAGATPVPDNTGRRLAAVALAIVVVVAVALRLVPIVVAPSLNWNDEIFQAIEPAHRLVYGYGLVAWEFQLGMRSWLLPGLTAGLMQLARLAGDGPDYYLPAIAIGFGLLSTAPVICIFLWCRRQFGSAGALVAASAVAVAPELVYFGARTLSEVAAAHLLVIAFYLIEPGYRVGSRRRLIAAGALFGVVCLLRVHLTPAVALIVLWSLAADWRSRLPAVAAGGLIAVAFGGALDWLTLGYPFASVWRNIAYNVFLGVSSSFDLNPWQYYAVGELGVWLAAAPVVVLLAAIGARRLPVLLAAAIVVVLLHSAIPHKEYRFIYPAILLVMMLAAIGLAELTSLAARWLAAHRVRDGIASAASAGLLLACWAGLAFVVWSGGALAALHLRGHDELLAVTLVRHQPTPCGVGLYGEEAWVRYGGYSYLHRPVPVFWPKDEADLAAAAPAFDTLIYQSVPPARLGFEPVGCVGHVCVARRPGSCELRAMPAMWFPKQLRDRAPPPRDYEALPAREPAVTEARP